MKDNRITQLIRGVVSFFSQQDEVEKQASFPNLFEICAVMEKNSRDSGGNGFVSIKTNIDKT